MKVEFRDSFAKDLKGVKEKGLLDTVVFVRFLNRKDIYKHFP